jgi:hypothetical protein
LTTRGPKINDLRIVNVKLQTVHVRVTDATSGQVTPVRVRFTDSEGAYYAPLGRLTDFATGRNQDVGGNVILDGQCWAYVDGSFEIELPPGPIHVAICKGPEFRPIAQTIQLKPGQLAMRFAVERSFDLPALGWYSGDGRAHFLAPHAAILEAQAEDVHVVNLLAIPAEIVEGDATKPVLSNILAFSGQRPCLETSDYLIAVNTHNAHPVLGSLALLNCHRVVYPLTLGGAEGKDDWLLADWCDQCHRKNGLVVWTHATHDNGFLGEPLLDLLLGQIDALEIDPILPPLTTGTIPIPPLMKGGQGGVIAPLCYDLWNAGLRVPLVGSSVKDCNSRVLGEMRTLARLQPGEPLSYQTWIEAVRAGRCQVTSGPALLFTVNDQDPGAVLTIMEHGATVHVRAEVQSLTPQRLEIVLCGRVVASTEEGKLEIDVVVNEAGWLAARCPDAHTSPVYIRFDKARAHRQVQAVARLLAETDRLEKWVEQPTNGLSEQAKTRLLAMAAAGRNVLKS